MPCDINDIDINLPDQPPVNIPGFGSPFSISLPLNKFQFPNGFPEDLLSIFNRLKLVLPSGILQPALNPNFAKDIFDGIMKLLDKFFPFLMLYKFFLPILNLIICIIEILCAFKNPIKVLRAIRKLFRVCIPDFLSLFPIFALIVMIISLLLLLLELIKYIIAQIIKLIELILKNIRALEKAIQKADNESILAISKKIAALLCVFQNLFVLLSAFAILFKTIKEILEIKFRIPPCTKSDPSTLSEQEFIDECCNSDVCPDYVLTNTNRQTGSFQYYNTVIAVSNIDVPFPNISGAGNKLSFPIRTSSYQLYDNSQDISERFINITDAYDIPEFINPKPVFFPTDVVYTNLTNPKQAAYTVDLKVFYNPASYNRIGLTYGIPRTIVFKDCIVLNPPTTNLYLWDNSITGASNGVLSIAGGTGYEADSTTPLFGFESDGYTISTNKATLENFLFLPTEYSTTPQLLSTDGYRFDNIEYTLKPNFETLFSKDLVAAACNPELRNDVDFVNGVVAGGFNLKLDLLTSLVNDPDRFPDLDFTQQCLQTAIDTLRTNLTVETLAQFQATTVACLTDLENKCNDSIEELIGIGIDTSKSKFTLDPVVQFTTQKIKVTVDLRDGNNQVITNNIPENLANIIAGKLSANVNLGTISNFTYDGSQFFETFISSDNAGLGSISIDYDNQSITTVTLPEDLDEDPTSVINSVEYRFVASGKLTGNDTGSAIDSDGTPRRDISDI